MSDLAALLLAAGFVGGSLFLGIALEGGLNAIARAIPEPKRYDVNLPPINVNHERKP